MMEYPIFVMYLNTESYPKSQVEELINQTKKTLSSFEVCKFIILPSDETKVEVLWKGKYEKRTPNKKIKKKLEFIIDLISEGVSDDVLRSKIRKLNINEILN
jgi:uncharacterized protein YegL